MRREPVMPVKIWGSTLVAVGVVVWLLADRRSPELTMSDLPVAEARDHSVATPTPEPPPRSASVPTPSLAPSPESFPQETVIASPEAAKVTGTNPRAMQELPWLFSLDSWEPWKRFEFLEQDVRHGDCGEWLEVSRSFALGGSQRYCSFTRFEPFVVISAHNSWPATIPASLRHLQRADQILTRALAPLEWTTSGGALLPLVFCDGGEWESRTVRGMVWIWGDPTASSPETWHASVLRERWSAAFDQAGLPAWWSEGVVGAAAMGALGTSRPIGVDSHASLESLILHGHDSLPGALRQQAVAWMAFCFSTDQETLARGMTDLARMASDGTRWQQAEDLGQSLRELLGVHDWQSLERHWKAWGNVNPLEQGWSDG